jgi:hypothetical protein
VDDLFISEERMIMEADRAVVSLKPDLSLGKTFALGLLPLGEYLQRRASAKGLRELGVSEHTQDGTKAERGDIADITNKTILAQPLTLTNRSLILSYKKGLMKKRNLVITIPLEFAKSVQEKGLLNKYVEINFEVPGKEGNSISFDIWLTHLSDRQTWLNSLNQLIAKS